MDHPSVSSGGGALTAAGVPSIRSFLDQLPDGVVLAGGDGRIVAANARFTATTGWASDALVGAPIEILVPAHRSGDHPLSVAVGTGSPTRTPTAPLRRPDGSTINLDLQVGPLQLGAERGLVATVRAVAPSTTPDDRLERAKRLHHVLAETNQAMLTRPDRDELLRASCRIAVEHGGFVMAWIGLRNDRGRIVPTAHAGHEDGYLSGIVVADDDSPAGAGPTGSALQSGEHVICQDIATDPRMSPWREAALRRGYRSSAACPLRVDGTVAGTLNVYADQSGYFTDDVVALLENLSGDLSLALQAVQAAERREDALHELQQREQRFRERAEHAQDLLYRFALEDGVSLEYVNEAAVKILGRTPRALMEDPDLGVRLGADEPLVPRLLALGPDEAHTVRVTRDDGTFAWLEHRVVVDRGPNGHPRAIEGIARETTGQRLTQLSLQQALQHERAAADRLRGLDAMKQTFLEAISHELRTPLSVIVGMAETLQRPEMAADASRRALLLPRLAAQARRLDLMLADLLDLDELTRGTVEIPRAVHDVAALVSEAVDAADLGGREVTVSAESAKAEVNPRQLRRVLDAIFDNVRVHTPPGTHVWVSCRTDDTVEITIDDDGPGVPSALHEQVFAPFHHGPHQHPEQPGAGIGLALAARLLTLQDGHIRLEDRPGGGARVRIELPRPRPASGETWPSRTRGAPTPTTSAMGDLESTHLVLEATRRIVASRSAQDVTGALVGFVESLDGHVSAHLDPQEGVPVDLGLDIGPPRFAHADDPARRAVLVEFLPRLAEHGSRVLDLLRLVDELARQAAIEPVTGLLDRTFLDRLLHRLQIGDVVIAMSLEPSADTDLAEQDTVLRGLAGVVRGQVRALDRAARGSDDLICIVLPQTSRTGAEALVGRVLAEWEASGASHQAIVGVGIAPVDTANGVSALRRAVTDARR